MSDFSYSESTFHRVVARMKAEAGFGQLGTGYANSFVASVPDAAGSRLFSESARAVRETGEHLAALHGALDRFWTHSAKEMEQTLASYQATDEEAAAQADLLYDEYLQSPVPEEGRP